MMDLNHFINEYPLREFSATLKIIVVKEYHSECMGRVENMEEKITKKKDPDLYDKLELKIKIEIKDRAWSQVRAVEQGEKIELKHWAFSARSLLKYVGSRKQLKGDPDPAVKCER